MQYIYLPYEAYVDTWLNGGNIPLKSARNYLSRERIIASWFMASTNNCRLTKAYCAYTNAFWSNQHFTNKNARFARPFIRNVGKILHTNPQRAALWVHPFVAKNLKLYPYHWFHYLFARPGQQRRRMRQFVASDAQNQCRRSAPAETYRPARTRHC